MELLRTTNYAGFNHYFGGFGFWEAFRTSEDLEKYPANPYTPLPPSEWTLERMRKGFYALPGGGTGDGAYLERFTGEINDDLNLPRALALAWELLRREARARNSVPSAS